MRAAFRGSFGLSGLGYRLAGEPKNARRVFRSDGLPIFALNERAPCIVAPEVFLLDRELCFFCFTFPECACFFSCPWCFCTTFSCVPINSMLDRALLANV